MTSQDILDAISYINVHRIISGILGLFVLVHVGWLIRLIMVSRKKERGNWKNLGLLLVVVICQFLLFVVFAATPFTLRSSGYVDYLDQEGISSSYTEVLFNLLTALKLIGYVWILYQRCQPILERRGVAHIKFASFFVKIIMFFYAGALVLGITYGFIEKPKDGWQVQVFNTLNWYSVGALMMTFFDIYYLWIFIKTLRKLSVNSKNDVKLVRLAKYGITCVLLVIAAECWIDNSR